LARALREELEARYGEEYAGLLDFMGELRGRMIAGGWDSPRVQRALSELYRRGLLGLLASGDRGSIDAFLREELGEEFPVPATP
jgi:hypothetical protein